MAVALALLHSAGCSIQYRSKAGYVGDNHSAFDESGDDAVFFNARYTPTPHSAAFPCQRVLNQVVGASLVRGVRGVCPRGRLVATDQFGDNQGWKRAADPRLLPRQ